jgi:hypothetical protein
MKYYFLLFLCLVCNALNAQIKTDNIWGSWVVTKVTHKDGTELPEENILKYTYVKYTFESPDKMFITQIYHEKGGLFLFEIINNELILKSFAGQHNKRHSH